MWYLGVFALVMAIFAGTIYVLVARNLNETTNSNLTEIAKSVEMDLHKEDADLTLANLQRQQSIKPDEEIDPGSEVLTIEDAIVKEIGDLNLGEYKVIVLDKNALPVVSSVTDTRLSRELLNRPDAAAFADVPGDLDVFRVFNTSMTLDGKPFRLLTIRSLKEQTDFLAGLRRVFYIAAPISLLLAGLGGYFLARRSLAPVVSMSNQAARIGSSNLNERLAVQNENDELGGLATIFNELLSRLEDSFNQQKQFMADASHELRTPLAIVRGESEVAISKEDRTAKDYRESLGIVHDESLHLTKIVEDLFILARADSGQLKPQFTEIYLDELLAECVRHVRVLADKKDVSLQFSSDGEMPTSGDENLLRELLLNLLDNAVKYNRVGGNVSVSAETADGHYSIIIADTGIGIPKEDHEKIFERFFRSDKARTRGDKTSGGGAGLGLSITKWIAEVHQGSVSLKKSDSDGSVFQVVLPQVQLPT